MKAAFYAGWLARQSERVAAVAGEPVSADVPETKPIDWPTMYGVYQAPDDYMGWRDNLAADIIANYRAQMITAG